MNYNNKSNKDIIMNLRIEIETYISSDEDNNSEIDINKPFYWLEKNFKKKMFETES